MVPTRMTIKLTMRVIYIGPMKDAVEYTKEQLAAEARIPLNEIKNDIFPVSALVNNDDTQSWWKKIGIGIGETLGIPIVGPLIGLPNIVGGALDAGESLVDSMFQTANAGNVEARKAALNWAQLVVIPGGTGFSSDDPGWTNYFGKDSGTGRYNLPHSADCSGLVTESFIRVGLGPALGWGGKSNYHPGTAAILSQARGDKKNFDLKELDSLNYQWVSYLQPEQQTLQYGDILIRDGHVVFVIGYERPSGKIIIFAAQSATSIPEVGRHFFTKGSYKWYRLRITAVGSTSSGAQTAVWNGPR
jgi:hypothetical protein